MSELAPPVMELLTAAAAARQRGDGREEGRLLENALRLAPGEPRILNMLGTHGLANGDPSGARDRFRAAAVADPSEPTLWINVATACRMLGDDAGERAALGAALDIDRRHFVGQLRLAELHERRGDLREAAQAWSAVVQLAATIDQPPPGIVDAKARGRAFLAAHNSALDTALDAALGDRLSAMGPAARRFRACVDHSLHGRTIYRNECAGVHFPFLPADEFFDRDLFPWLSAVEARTDAIRAEALAIMAGGGAAIRPYVRMDKGTPDNKWTALDGSLDWSACFLWEYGVRNDAVCDLCPETAAALDLAPQNRVVGKAPSAFFSILKPGAHIPPHTGVTNTRAIIHLPLVVPDGCRFRVGGETREWREGEAFAFDDTIEHEAWNDSDKPRIVLIFDVWNPHLTPDEQALLADFYAITDPQ
ncbi:aspartyl/asparaginyl beta-hydroxylase domain-containing protein [Sphingomonas sp. SUN039]|uniref:aspartyl/asparaginyl beta-hydroxylase domain-containing protein n=1 Tax=Sphingomonas sp. SUN039 TaxID=2937787 RepID=UPI002164CD33|nr:aspartyl/asparaginyl beta-hydroxylase domain-containing protein [Sphingomonas sp. SUN039]UVO54925.1 aspartyl/asparaginyl beta-hydroxylase domain-containing protein [Sphingomonas sp. SUN039]